MEFLEEQQFLVNYIFKYDPRPSTRAHARLPDDVPEALKKERNQRLLEVAERVQRRRFGRRRGTVLSVFVESVSKRDERVLLGRTTLGQPLSFQGQRSLVGSLAQVVVDENTAYGMAGHLAP